MSEQTANTQRLSEISHLFLSTLRERSAGTAGGPARPVRIPPARRRDGSPVVSVDLSPEEFAEVIGEPDARTGDLPPLAPVTAVVAHHFGPRQSDHVREYARHLSSGGERVGLIEVDASEFRLMCFEHNPLGGAAGSDPPEATLDTLDGRRIEEALSELAWDINRWLVVVPNSRCPEARALLRSVDSWTMLATCDHDGIVACYRTIKGMADLQRRDADGAALPRLSLALLDAPDAAASGRIYRKFAGVCQQFLDWRVDHEPSVSPAHDVAEHLVLACAGGHDKAQLANGPQWKILGDFFNRPSDAAAAGRSVDFSQMDSPTPARVVDAAGASPFQIPPAPAGYPAARNDPDTGATSARPSIPVSPEVAMPFLSPVTPTAACDPEVIDLPGGLLTPASIVSAVIRSGGQLVECPVRPPMCLDASLAVSRDRTLVLVAVALQGLTDLRSIGLAYRWLTENRSLLSMAMPQMSIDAHALPQLQLLVDYADSSADLLQPMLQSSSVKVHAYRKLRWSGKTGLLLEAA